MTDSSNSDSKHLSSGPTSPVGVGRRRLLRAGLAATPVVLAVSGRSAMAGNACKGLSPLAWASVAPNGTCVVDGTSHTIESHALGNSPGGWTPNCGLNAKTFQWDWPTTHCQPCVSVKNVYNQSISWSSGWNAFSSVPSTATGWAGGTKYNAKFGGTDTRSFTQILLAGNISSDAKWHLCAAYLNAARAALGAGDYALSMTDVVRLGTTGQLLVGGPILTVSQIKSFLDQTWGA